MGPKPNKKQNKRHKPSNPSRSLKTYRARFTEVGYFEANITANGAGYASSSYSTLQFGLGSTGTYQITVPLLVSGAAGTPSFATNYRLRLRSIIMTYLPTYSAVASYNTVTGHYEGGFGAAVAVVLNEQRIAPPSVTFGNLIAYRNAKLFRPDQRVTMTWRPANTDHLWITSDVAQSTIIPNAGTTLGSTFIVSMQNLNGVNAYPVGNLIFKFLIEIELP